MDIFFSFFGETVCSLQLFTQTCQFYAIAGRSQLGGKFTSTIIFSNLSQMIVMFFYLPTVEVAMGKLEADEKVLCIELLLKVALIGPAILLPLLGPDTPDPLLADSSPWTSCPACPCCGCPAKAITPTALQKQLLNPAILCTPMGCTINLITITITITTITITTSTCKNGQCGKVKEETNVGIT